MFGIVNNAIPLLGKGDGAGSSQSMDADGVTPSGRNPTDGQSAPPDTVLHGCKVNESPGGWALQEKIPLPREFASEKPTVDFADINGDKLDDYLAITREKGKATVRVRAMQKSSGDSIELAQYVQKFEFPLDSGKEDIDFADLDGDGRDEYLAVNRETWAAKAWKFTNDTDDSNPYLQIDTRNFNGKEEGTKIVFADIDGDGRDDQLAIDKKSGAVQAWLNLDANHDGSPDWEPHKNIIEIDLREDGTPTFHNVDCDKRADYLVETKPGPVMARLNDRTSNKERFSWEKKVIQIANGADLSKDQRRDFADLNGDGRADILWIDKEETVMPHINKGGDRD